MTRTLNKLRDDVEEGRKERKRIKTKYGFIPESIIKIDYSRNKNLKQLVTTQNQKAKDYHKDKYYASDPELLKALGASSKSVRGKEGGLSIFPYHLAEFIIKFYSEKGETIFDPFAGHNSRMQIVFNLGRNYIGYDISKDFMGKNFRIKDNITNQCLITEGMPKIELYEKDSRYIHLEDDSVDMIFTSPPYWNLEYYGDEEEQLGERPYAEFLKELQKCFFECERILKYDRHMIINCNDFRAGNYYSYHSDIISLMKNTHLPIYDVGIVDWGSSIASCFASQIDERKYLAKRHEYLLIFKKA